MLTLLFFFFFSLGLLLLLGLLLKLAYADGDLTLILKKHVKREAIQGKVVWITVANRGIGQALAKQFASLGAKLILSVRTEDELVRLKSELKGKYAPEHVKVLRLNYATGETWLKNDVEQALSLFPGNGVDYLIHNAAYELPKSNAVDASEENLKTIFKVNVFETISLTKFVIPHMLKKGGGHFVVISSAAGKIPSPGQAIYAASKHALQGYFHTLRSEFYQKGIKVTVVCPGPIETSKGTGTSTSKDKKSPEKRMSSERCAELIVIAASHNLKEAWISYQPVLLVMYLVQYMPFLGFWLMDKTRACSTSTYIDTNELFTEMKEKWNGLEIKTTVIIYGGGAIVAVCLSSILVWLSSILVGAINSVPLLPKVLELVGLGCTGWFVFRYLLIKSSRKELAEDIGSLKKKITGTE